MCVCVCVCVCVGCVCVCVCVHALMCLFVCNIINKCSKYMCVYSCVYVDISDHNCECVTEHLFMI